VFILFTSTQRTLGNFNTGDDDEVVEIFIILSQFRTEQGR